MPVDSPPAACTRTIASIKVGILATLVPPCSVVIVSTGGTVVSPFIIVSIFSGKSWTVYWSNCGILHLICSYY